MPGINELKQKIETLISKAKPAYGLDVVSAKRNLFLTELSFYKSDADKEVVLSVALEILRYGEKHNIDYKPAHSLRKLSQGLLRKKEFLSLKKLAVEVVGGQELSNQPASIREYGKKLLLQQIAKSKNELPLPENLIHATINLTQAERKFYLAKKGLEAAIEKANLSAEDSLRLSVEGVFAEADNLFSLSGVNTSDVSAINKKLNVINEKITELNNAAAVVTVPNANLKLLAIELLEETDEINQKLAEFEIAGVDSWGIYQLASDVFFSQINSGKVAEEDNGIFVAKLQEAKKFIEELYQLKTTLLANQLPTEKSKLKESSERIVTLAKEKLQAFINNTDTTKLNILEVTKIIKRVETVQIVLEAANELQQKITELSVESLREPMQSNVHKMVGLLTGLDIGADNFAQEIQGIVDKLKISDDLITQTKELQETMAVLQAVISEGKLSDDALRQFAIAELDSAKLFMQPTANVAVSTEKIAAIVERLQGVVKFVADPDDSLKSLVGVSIKLQEAKQKLGKIGMSWAENWLLFKDAQEFLSLQLSFLSLGEKLTSEDIAIIEKFTQQLQVADQLVEELYKFTELYKEHEFSNPEIKDYAQGLTKEVRTILLAIINDRALPEENIITIRKDLTDATNFINETSKAEDAVRQLQTTIQDKGVDKENKFLQFARVVLSKQQKILQQIKNDTPKALTIIADLNTTVGAAHKLLDLAPENPLEVLVAAMLGLSQAVDPKKTSGDLLGGIQSSVNLVVEQTEKMLLEVVGKEPSPDVTEITGELYSINRLVTEAKKLRVTMMGLEQNHPFYNATKDIFTETQDLLKKFVDPTVGFSHEQKTAAIKELSEKLQIATDCVNGEQKLQNAAKQLQAVMEKLPVDLHNRPFLNAIKKVLAESRSTSSEVSFTTEKITATDVLYKQVIALPSLLKKVEILYENSTKLMQQLQETQATEPEKNRQELYEIVTREFSEDDFAALQVSDDLFTMLIADNFTPAAIGEKYKTIDGVIAKIQLATQLSKKLEERQFFEQREKLTLAMEKLQTTIEGLDAPQKDWFLEVVTSMLHKGNELLGTLKNGDINLMSAVIETMQPLTAEIHTATELLTNLDHYPDLQSLAQEIAEFPEETNKKMRMLEFSNEAEVLDVTSWKAFIDTKALLYKQLTGQGISPRHGEDYDKLYQQNNLKVIRELLDEMVKLKSMFNVFTGAAKFSQRVEDIFTKKMHLLEELIESEDALSFIDHSAIHSSLENTKRLFAEIQELQTVIDANLGSEKLLRGLGDNFFDVVLDLIISDIDKSWSGSDRNVSVSIADRVTATRKFITVLAENKTADPRDYQLLLLLNNMQDLTAQTQKFFGNTKLQQVLKESREFIVEQLVQSNLSDVNQEQIMQYNQRLEAIQALVKESNNLRLQIKSFAEIKIPAIEFAEKFLGESEAIFTKIDQGGEVAVDDMFVMADKLRATKELLEQAEMLQETITKNFSSTEDLKGFAAKFNARVQRQIVTEFSNLDNYSTEEKQPVSEINREAQITNIKNIQGRVKKLKYNIRFFQEFAKGYNPTKKLVENVFALIHVSSGLFAQHEMSSGLMLSKVEDLYEQLLDCDDSSEENYIFLDLDVSSKENFLWDLESEYEVAVEDATILAAELNKLHEQPWPKEERLKILVLDVLEDGKKILLDPPITRLNGGHHYATKDAIENTQNMRRILMETTELAEVINTSLKDESHPFYGFANVLNGAQDFITEEAIKIAQKPYTSAVEVGDLSLSTVRRKTINILAEYLPRAIKIIKEPKASPSLTELLAEITKAQTARRELEGFDVDLTELQQVIVKGNELLLWCLGGEGHYSGERDEYGWLKFADVEKLTTEFVPKLSAMRKLAEKLVLLKKGPKTQHLVKVEKLFNDKDFFKRIQSQIETTEKQVQPQIAKDQRGGRNKPFFKVSPSPGTIPVLEESNAALVLRDKNVNLRRTGSDFVIDNETFAKCYEILGLEFGSSQAAVRKNYKKMALIFHPDKNAGVGGERFVIIQAAYEFLMQQQSEFMQHKPLPLGKDAATVDIDKMSNSELLKRTDLLGMQLEKLLEVSSGQGVLKDPDDVPSLLALEVGDVVEAKIQTLHTKSANLLAKVETHLNMDDLSKPVDDIIKEAKDVYDNTRDEMQIQKHTLQKVVNTNPQMLDILKSPVINAMQAANKVTDNLSMLDRNLLLELQESSRQRFADLKRLRLSLQMLLADLDNYTDKVFFLFSRRNFDRFLSCFSWFDFGKRAASRIQAHAEIVSNTQNSLERLNNKSTENDSQENLEKVGEREQKELVSVESEQNDEVEEKKEPHFNKLI